MTTKSPTQKPHHRRWLLRLAALCLALSFAAAIQEAVVHYNRSVATEQTDKFLADNKIDLAVDAWGINYQERNRHLIFVISAIGFVLAVFDRRRLTLLTYSIIGVLAFQWVFMTIRDISMTEMELSNSEYLQLIAFPIDWLQFLTISVLIAVNITLLARGVK